MHFIKYYRFALQLKSLGDFGKVPDDSVTVITRYLNVKDRVNFTLLTCKKMHEAAEQMSGYEAKRFAKLLGLEGYVSDAEVLREMKILTMVLMRLVELESIDCPFDFGEIFKFVNVKLRTLNLPVLTLLFLSGKENLRPYSVLMKKVVEKPKKYKNVLRHLSRDRYKCNRNQLIDKIKQENTDLKRFDFNDLIEYNEKSRTRVFLRDGLLFALAVTTISTKLLYIYMIVIDSATKTGDLTKWLPLFSLIMGIVMHLYLNRRYEQYTE